MPKKATETATSSKAKTAKGKTAPVASQKALAEVKPVEEIVMLTEETNVLETAPDYSSEDEQEKTENITIIPEPEQDEDEDDDEEDETINDVVVEEDDEEVIHNKAMVKKYSDIVEKTTADMLTKKKTFDETNKAIEAKYKALIAEEIRVNNLSYHNAVEKEQKVVNDALNKVEKYKLLLNDNCSLKIPQNKTINAVKKDGSTKKERTDLNRYKDLSFIKSETIFKHKALGFCKNVNGLLWRCDADGVVPKITESYKSLNQFCSQNYIKMGRKTTKVRSWFEAEYFDKKDQKFKTLNDVVEGIYIN
jgi:hypothetical protein